MRRSKLTARCLLMVRFLLVSPAIGALAPTECSVCPALTTSPLWWTEPSSSLERQFDAEGDELTLGLFNPPAIRGWARRARVEDRADRRGSIT